MNQLFLLRHAKSSWASNHLSDFDRPLNNRGRRNAMDLGESFFEKKLKIDHVLFKVYQNNAHTHTLRYTQTHTDLHTHTYTYIHYVCY